MNEVLVLLHKYSYSLQLGFLKLNKRICCSFSLTQWNHTFISPYCELVVSDQLFLVMYFILAIEKLARF